MKAALLITFVILTGTAAVGQKRLNIDMFPKSLLPSNSFILNNSVKLGSQSFETIKNPLFVKHELPQGAVFCRMEEKLWRQFNVWVKIRAGSDEMYRQLIQIR